MRKLRYYFLIIIFISLASAMPQINLQKETYQAQETLLGTIEGTISDIDKIDLKIYEDRRELSLDKEIVKYNEKYYFYIILPKEGLFRLEIKGLIYNDTNGNLKSQDIIKNISVKNILDENNKTSILGIRPGLINSFSEKISIYLTNFGSNELNVEYLSKKINLSIGESEKIDLILNVSFDEILIKSYSEFKVPLIYLGFYQNISENQTQDQQNQTENKLVKLTTNIESLKIAVLKNKTQNYNFSLINLGDRMVQVYLYSENDLIIFEKNNFSLENKSVQEINLQINYLNLNETDYTIFIYGDNEKVLELPVEIYVFDNETPSNFTILPVERSCDELGGILCASDESCDGDYTPAGGLCCFAKCVSTGEKPTNPKNIFVGIAIFLVVIFAIYYFYKKFKQAKLPGAEEKLKSIINKPKK